MPAFLITLIVSVGCAVGAAEQQPRPGPPVDRTTPILNKITPAQRERAKRYNRPEAQGRKLLDHLESTEVLSDPGGAANPRTAADIIRETACNADTVVSGYVADATSFPSTDGTMLFTEYGAVVTYVFRSAEHLPIFNGEKLTLTRIGGSVTVDGRRIVADIRAVPMLEQGQTYLFFLKRLPKSAAFHADRSSSAWVVRDGRVLSLGGLSASDVNLVTQGISLETVTDWLRGMSCQE